MSGPLHVTCPSCGKSGDVPASFAGKDIHCRKCDAHFIVPGAVQAHAPAQAQDQGQEHATASFDRGPAPTAPVPPPPPPMDADVESLLDSLPVDDTPPPAAPPQPAVSLLDNLSDDAPLAPLSDDDEKHARQRYEARVLSKDRVARYDDHGNRLSEAEYEERVKQGRNSVH